MKHLRDWRVWLILAFIAFAGIAVEAMKAHEDAPSQWAAICRNRSAEMDHVLESWASTLRGVSGDAVRVEDSRWDRAPHDAKISIAIAAFCKAKPDGRGTITIRGYRDGRIKATVIDGNFFD